MTEYDFGDYNVEALEKEEAQIIDMYLNDKTGKDADYFYNKYASPTLKSFIAERKRMKEEAYKKGYIID